MPAYTIHKMGSGYMHYIELDAATVKKLASSGNKRVVCELNKTITLHAAIMKTKEGMHYIMIAAKHLKQLRLKAGSTVTATLRKDTSELQFSIPEEFAEVFDTDPEAKQAFDALTDGRKRGLIAWAGMVKSSEKKIERALKIADRLKQGITDLRQLIK
jgi:hypothetical protein